MYDIKKAATLVLRPTHFWSFFTALQTEMAFGASLSVHLLSVVIGVAV